MKPFHAVERNAPWLLIAIAAFVVAGWTFGFYPFDNTLPSMKMLTALGVLAFAVGLLVDRPAAPHPAAALAGIVVVALAALAADARIPPAMRPSPFTLAMLAVAGLGLVLLAFRRSRPLAEWPGMLCGLFGLIVLLARIFDVPATSRTFGLFGTSCLTALAGIIGGMLLVWRAGGVFHGLLRDEGSAGLLARRLPLLLLALLVLAGWLRLQGELRDWYGTREGLTYMVGFAILSGIVAVLVVALPLRQSERRRREQTALLDGVFEGTSDAVSVKDRDGRYLIANRVTLGILGLERAAVIGRSDADIMPAADAEALRAADRRVMASGEDMHVEERLSAPGGDRYFLSSKSPLRSADGEIVGIIGIAHEITAEKRQQAELEYQATHDALTGLANRSLLRDRLAQGLALAERHRQQIALIVLDLDAFKRINEDLSYEAGDSLLRSLAVRITACVRRGDTVARVYGDEFVIVLGEVEGRDYVNQVVRRILEAIGEPWLHEGHEIVVGASAGISLYPADAHNPDEMEKHAEMAMHRAKELGRNRHEFYTPTDMHSEGKRVDRERALRHALESGEMVLHYQPKVDLESGLIAGAEALIRWQHPQHGVLGPDRFMPLAEESGLIVPISEWVIAEGCSAVRRWQAAGLDCGPIALNLSGRQLQDPALAGRIRRIVDDAGIAPSAIELEVTETSVLRDQEETARILHGFHEMGIKLALDDFGTGYSSLAFLRKFPISCLKIDRSFVRDIHTDAGDAAIARTVIAMAHALKLHAVAEGVETAAQLRYLRHYRCDQMQGFLFSRAIPGDEFAALVERGAGLDFATLGVAVQRCLLLVDDEEGVISSLKRLFRRDGYRILSAASGEDALKLLADNEVQVIISDQRMDGMSGTELLARVADLYPETIRIMLTGYTDLQSVITSVNRGAIWKFLTKPWDDAPLREQVRDAFLQYEAKYGR